MRHGYARRASARAVADFPYFVKKNASACRSILRHESAERINLACRARSGSNRVAIGADSAVRRLTDVEARIEIESRASFVQPGAHALAIVGQQVDVATIPNRRCRNPRGRQAARCPAFFPFLRTNWPCPARRWGHFRHANDDALGKARAHRPLLIGCDRGFGCRRCGQRRRNGCDQGKGQGLHDPGGLADALEQSMNCRERLRHASNTPCKNRPSGN